MNTTADAPEKSAGQELKEILSTVLDRRKFLEECTPGYYNGEGQLSPKAASFSSVSGASVVRCRRRPGGRTAFR